MKINSILTSLFILLGVLNQSFAQSTNIISGKVTDSDGKPLEAVTVLLLRSNIGTATDSEGNFTLDVKNYRSGELVFSSIGFISTSMTFSINDSRTVSVQMKSQLTEMPRVEVVGEKETLFSRTPGSVTTIGPEQMKQMAPFSGNEAFRSISGVNVVDEEGAGLRMNLGIRGLDPDRSRSVLVLEDGIPVALSPYGEPELYYTPSIDRMASIEVLKGSGSILYGPQTIGGVVNYITADPPASSKGQLDLRGGTGNYLSQQLSYGTTVDRTGFLVNYLRKQADQIGTAQFKTDDFMGKIKLMAGASTTVGLKIGYYQETSNSTYLGLTQSMYDNGEYFTIMAPEDRLEVKRVSGSLAVNHFFSQKTKWTNTLFAYTTNRDWKRQDFASNSFDSEGNLNPKPTDYSGVTWGDETIAGGAIYMRNRTGNRNRQFEVAGLESKITHSFERGELNAGLRYVGEKALEQRINGSMPQYNSGSLAEDEMRTGRGMSGFAHGRKDIGKRLSLTAGIRTEYFSYARDINRGTYNGSVRDTSIVKESNVLGVIPGGGFNWSFGQTATLFGGVHMGFAPPRVKDAISNQGEVYELEAEKSWNYELGIRSQTKQGIDFEFNLFLLDFSNQIIPVSESSGGTGAGLVNGGKTIHQGAEASVVVNFKHMFDTKFLLEWRSNATFVDARLGSDRFIPIGEETVNVNNNRTPYAPGLLINSSLAFESPMGIGAHLRTVFVGEQYTDIENTEAPTANGREGKIDAYQLWDAGIWYNHKKSGLTFRVSSKNATDDRYIASRRPQGIKAGAPRLLLGSISFAF